jgi:hypothetical protein
MASFAGFPSAAIALSRGQTTRAMCGLCLERRPRTARRKSSRSGCGESMSRVPSVWAGQAPAPPGNESQRRRVRRRAPATMQQMLGKAQWGLRSMGKSRVVVAGATRSRCDESSRQTSAGPSAMSSDGAVAAVTGASQWQTPRWAALPGRMRESTAIVCTVRMFRPGSTAPSSVVHRPESRGSPAGGARGLRCSLRTVARN